LESSSDGDVAVDPRLAAIPDSHGHAKGEHKPFAEERPIPYTARMLFLWFFHACKRGSPRFMMVADHMNYLTFEDPAAVNLVRRALKLAQAGDLYGAAETAGVDVAHAQVVSEGLRRGMRYSIGAEVDNDPRSRPDAQNIVDAMRPDGMVRSVHFLPITHPTHGENWLWAFDNPEFKDLYEVVGTEAVWEIYMATLMDAVEKLPGHIVGHFYVPAVFGHWPDDAVLEGYEDRLIDACAERGMAIELNSRYFYKHYVGDEVQLEKFRAAHLRLMRKAVEKGVAIAVGSDAHSPKDQGRGFEQVLALLDEAEINEIAFPLGGRLARVALRATEEILKQYAAPEPEPAPQPALPEPEAEAEAEPAPVAAAAPEKVKKPRPSRAKAAPAADAATIDVAEVAANGEAAATDAGDDVDSHHAPEVEAEAEPPEAVVLAHAEAPVEAEEHPEEPSAAPAPAKRKAASRSPKPEPAEAPAEPSLVERVLEPVVALAKAAIAKVAPVKAPPKKTPPKKTAAAAPTPAPKKAAPAPKKASAAKKATSKKTVAKKAPVAKKTAAKPAAKKTAAKAVAKKRPVAKKSVAKKAPAAKKSVAKKSAPAKKSVAKKTPAKAAKRAAAKRPAPKKSPAKKPARRARR
jgi:HisJ family histidinol phosphate phosphatase